MVRTGPYQTRILVVSLPAATDQNTRSAAGHGAKEPVDARRTRSRRAAAFLPTDVLLWEILIRLPAAAVLRCRAVCRSWRGLASDPGFLLAHHPRQPSLPLFVLRGYSATKPAGPERAQPLLGCEVQIRRLGDRGFTLHASCDGLLLISFSNRSFFICNPATRQESPVPGLNAADDCINIKAMYLHRPSGEYRVLYWHDRGNQTNHSDAVCYVLGVPSAHKPRGAVVPPAASLCLQADPNSHPPVMFRGCLHWHPSRRSLDDNRVLVVFDTVDESFSSMRLPAAAVATSCCTRLHDIEGSIALSCFDDHSTVAKIWVLEDYERKVWSLKYQIKFSPESMCNLAKTSRHLVLSHEGDMLFYAVDFGTYMVHYKGKFLEKFRWKSWGRSTLTGHFFKESLIKHAFFTERGSAPTVGHPCFFSSL